MHEMPGLGEIVVEWREVKRVQCVKVNSLSYRVPFAAVFQRLHESNRYPVTSVTCRSQHSNNSLTINVHARDSSPAFHSRRSGVFNVKLDNLDSDGTYYKTLKFDADRYLSENVNQCVISIHFERVLNEFNVWEYFNPTKYSVIPINFHK